MDVSPQSQHARMDASTTSNMEDDSMIEQPMSVFSLDDRRCPCLLCAQGPPLILQRDSVAWYGSVVVFLGFSHQSNSNLKDEHH